MVNAIVAVGKNWEIGKNNSLLFKLPKDMLRFKDLTMHSILICGEHTLQSFPGQRPLKGRATVVLAREGHNYENCICMHSLDAIVNFIKVMSTLKLKVDIWIIGGGYIYEALLPYCDHVLVTKVEASDKEATAFFPNIDDRADFSVLFKAPPVRDGDYLTEYWVYERHKMMA